VEVGDGMARLVGYSVEPRSVTADAPFTLVLYWQASAPTNVPYTAFVHITPPDAAGPVVAQDDAWPALNLKPTYTWVPGEVVADAHALPALPAGIYALRVGMYGPDGVRLPLTVDGVLARDGAAVVTTVEVR